MSEVHLIQNQEIRDFRILLRLKNKIKHRGGNIFLLERIIKAEYLRIIRPISANRNYQPVLLSIDSSLQILGDLLGNPCLSCSTFFSEDDEWFGQ